MVPAVIFPFVHNRNGDRKMGNAVQEVCGAVNRVNNPARRILYLRL